MKTKKGEFYLDVTKLREALPAYAAWLALYLLAACSVVSGIIFGAFGETTNGIPVGDIDAARGVALAVLAITGFVAGLSSLSLAWDCGEAEGRKKWVRK